MALALAGVGFDFDFSSPPAPSAPGPGRTIAGRFGGQSQERSSTGDLSGKQRLGRSLGRTSAARELTVFPAFALARNPSDQVRVGMGSVVFPVSATDGGWMPRSYADTRYESGRCMGFLDFSSLAETVGLRRPLGPILQLDLEDKVVKGASLT